VVSVSDDPVRIAQFWQAVEIFSPRALPERDIRKRAIDVQPGEPMPWEPGFLSTLGEPEPGYAWRHSVYGGLFPLTTVRAALAASYGQDRPEGPGDPPPGGESALFACTIDGTGRLAGGSVTLSACAWALGRVSQGKSPFTGFDDDTRRFAGELGRLKGVRPGVRELAAALDPGTDPGTDPGADPGTPGPPMLAAADLRRFTIELAVRLGVNGILAPRGIRVVSLQVRADQAADVSPPLFSFLHDDLARIVTAIEAGDTGLALRQYLTGDINIDESRRTDVRLHPRWMLDWCRPDQIPPGRWVAGTGRPLVFSQQFAVNQVARTIGTGLPGLFALHGAPGTGKTTVLRDLIADIVVQRATELASLVHPEEGFAGQQVHRWQAGRYVHSITPLTTRLTGHEILLASPVKADRDQQEAAAERAAAEICGRDTVGPQWREAAGRLDYFAATAQEVTGPGSWALIATDPGSRGVLAGILNMLGACAEPGGGGVPNWRAAIDNFRAAMANVANLAAERAVVSRHIASLPDSLAGRDQAAAAVRKAKSARDSLQSRRQEIDADQPCLTEPPGILSALTPAARRTRQERRAADQAARGLDQQISGWFDRENSAQAEFETWAARAAESWQEADAARQRWGAHVPSGEEYGQVHDSAAAGGRKLIERRELSAPWADEEFCQARTELFLAALALHKAFVVGQARRIRANLMALADMLAGRGQPDDPAAVLAAWQTLFLVVPVTSGTFTSLSRMLSGLGRESLGWLLAEHAGQAAPQDAAGALWRCRRAVIAGDPLHLEPPAALPPQGMRALSREFGTSGEWARGGVSVQRVADRLAAAGTRLSVPATEGSRARQLWVGTPLRVRWKAEKESGHEQTGQAGQPEQYSQTSSWAAYDGLLISTE
jgi:hypothetical protein